MIFKFPLDFIGIKQPFSSTHRGIDLGWHNYQGEPVYAAADGVVYSTNDYDGTGQSWGNFVKLSHGDNWYTLYAHLMNGLCVKNGQQVKQGDLLGYMGNTGYSYGTHLHYEVYQGGVDTSHRIDPLKVTYVFPGQQVSEGSKDSVLYYNESTHPVAGDNYFVNDSDGLYLLDDNGSKIRAYVENTQVEYLEMGYYKYGYQYYKVKVLSDDAIGYMASDFLTLIQNNNSEPTPEPTPNNDETIKELEQQIAELNNAIDQKDKEIGSLKEFIKCMSECKDEFLIDSDNQYRVKIKEGEILSVKPNKNTEYTINLSKGDIVKVK